MEQVSQFVDGNNEKKTKKTIQKRTKQTKNNGCMVKMVITTRSSANAEEPCEHTVS